MKKVIVFAGNNRRAEDFILHHRFLNHDNAEYLCSEEKFRSIMEGDHVIGYVLAGEYWLNPVYRSQEHSILAQRGDIRELITEKEICEFLGIDWIPGDIQINIQESIDSTDKVL